MALHSPYPWLWMVRIFAVMMINVLCLCFPKSFCCHSLTLKHDAGLLYFFCIWMTIGSLLRNCSSCSPNEEQKIILPPSPTSSSSTLAPCKVQNWFQHLTIGAQKALSELTLDELQHSSFLLVCNRRWVISHRDKLHSVFYTNTLNAFVCVSLLFLLLINWFFVFFTDFFFQLLKVFSASA